MRKRYNKMIKLCCLVMMMLFISTSCNKDKSIEKKSEKSDTDVFKYDKSVNESEKYKYFKERPIKANEVLLFHIYKDNLGVYNTDTKKWNEFYDSAANNLFTYNVRGQQQKDVFYTIGSSSYNDFSIVKYNQENRMVESLMDVNDSDSVIPIGTYEGKMYFMHNKDDLGDNETRAIAYMDGDKLVDVLELKKELLSNAVIIDEKLYYAIYSEGKDKFDLYSYSFDDGEIKKLSQIDSDYIYRYKNELLYIDDNKELVNLENKKYYKLKDNSDIDVLSDYDLMIQSYISEDNDIACDLINLNDGSVLETVNKFDGYNINDDVLTLYCEGSIKNLEIDKWKR